MLQYSYPLKGIRSNIMKQESFNRFESNGDIDLNFCGTEICAPDFYAPPAIREEYLIHYILSGSGVFQTPSGIYQIHTGDIFLIYPGIPISYRANPLDPFHFSWIGFSGSRIPKVLNGLHFSKENCVRHLHSRYAFHDRIMQCIAQLDSPSSTNEYQLLSDLLWVFSQIKNSYDADVLVRDHRNEIKEHVEKAMTYIRLNYSHQIQVKSIALYVGLERSYFSKIFHTYTGKTVQDYISEVRIQQSKLLLIHTSYLVRQIATYVGFSDVSYFSRAFKKREGCSPAAFREKAASS